MSEGIADVLVIVPFLDPDFGTMTFSVCGLDDLMRNLMEDDPEPDEMYADGIVGAFQRAAIETPFSVGTPKGDEALGFLERAAKSNSAEGRFTYWDKEEET